MKKNILIVAFLIMLASIALSQTDLHWVGANPIIMNPASPNAGDIVTFSASVRASNANSPAFQVVGGIDGVELFNQMGPALTTGKSKAFSFTWTATGGNHTVYFEIDPNKTIGDTDYSNNRTEFQFFVTGGTSTPPPPRRGRDKQPNLIIKNVTWNPQSFANGDKIDFQILVANAGSAEAPITYVSLEIGGVTYQSSFTNALQPGDTAMVQASGIANACPADVTIKADFTNLAVESDEGDNTWAKKIACTTGIIQPGNLTPTYNIDIKPRNPKGPGNPKNPTFSIPKGTPNLVIWDLSWTPKIFNEGQKVTFTWRAKNIGNGPAEPRPSVVFTLGNTTIATAKGYQGSVLNPGDSTPLKKYVWTAKCGEKLSIVVDPETLIVETNEMDNFYEHTFYQNECHTAFIPENSNQNLPNLQIVGTWFSPLETSFGTGISYNFDAGDQPVNLTITIKNSGNVAAPASKYQFIVNGKVVITDSIALGPNQQWQLGWYGTMNCGSNSKFILDVDNTVKESNENDNTKTFNSWPVCK